MHKTQLRAMWTRHPLPMPTPQQAAPPYTPAKQPPRTLEPRKTNLTSPSQYNTAPHVPLPRYYTRTYPLNSKTLQCRTRYRPHHALPTRAHPLPARRLTAVVDPKMPSSKPKRPRHLHLSASASALNLPPKDNPNAPTPIQKSPHHPPLRNPPSRIATPHH